MVGNCRLAQLMALNPKYAKAFLGQTGPHQVYTPNNARGWPATHPFENNVLTPLSYPTYGSLTKDVNEQ